MAFSLTAAQAAEKAHNMSILDGDETIVTVADVELLIPEAVLATCDLVAKSSEWYRLQAAPQNVTVTDGIGNLPAAIMAETLMDSRGGEVTFTRTDITDSQFTGSLKYFSSIADLRRPRPGGDLLGGYAVRGGTSGTGRIYVYSALGVPATGTAVILACQYFTFSTMPAQLEDDFIMTLAEMVKVKIGEGGASSRAEA